MPKILGHHRKTIPQRQRQPLIEMVMRRHALRNRLCSTQQNVA
jgi:hypothetical protein